MTKSEKLDEIKKMFDTFWHSPADDADYAGIVILAGIVEKIVEILDGNETK